MGQHKLRSLEEVKGQEYKKNQTHEGSRKINFYEVVGRKELGPHPPTKVQPGMKFQTEDGRTYQIQQDGSWKRLRKEEVVPKRLNAK